MTKGEQIVALAMSKANREGYPKLTEDHPFFGRLRAFMVDKHYWMGTATDLLTEMNDTVTAARLWKCLNVCVEVINSIVLICVIREFVVEAVCFCSATARQSVIQILACYVDVLIVVVAVHLCLDGVVKPNAAVAVVQHLHQAVIVDLCRCVVSIARNRLQRIDAVGGISVNGKGFSRNIAGTVPKITAAFQRRGKGRYGNR